MSKIYFLTDSASDISAQEEKELGLKIAPFPISFGEKTYISRVDFDNDRFYQLLEESPNIPSTSQITVFEYTQYFEEAFKEGYTDVINVTINSEGSGTYNSACLAAQMFVESHPEAAETFHIYNLDGASYNCGYGYAVVRGAQMDREGKSLEEILSFMRDWLTHSVIYFAPYSLKYAAKSGRIPSAAAFVGELVGLKAIMRIADHKIVTDDKVRGEKKIIPTIKAKTLKDIQEGSDYIVIYGNNREDADTLAQVMTEVLGYPPSSYAQIGAAVAANAGPRVVGVGFRAKD